MDLDVHEDIVVADKNMNTRTVDQLRVFDRALSQQDKASRADPAATKLQAKDLNFFYGSFRALADINLDIPENRITALTDL